MSMTSISSLYRHRISNSRYDATIVIALKKSFNKTSFLRDSGFPCFDFSAIIECKAIKFFRFFACLSDIQNSIIFHSLNFCLIFSKSWTPALWYLSSHWVLSFWSSLTWLSLFSLEGSWHKSGSFGASATIIEY